MFKCLNIETFSPFPHRDAKVRLWSLQTQQVYSVQNRIYVSLTCRHSKSPVELKQIAQKIKVVPFLVQIKLILNELIYLNQSLISLMSHIIFFSLKVLPSTERFNLNVSYFKTHFCHALLTYRRGLLPPLKVNNYLQKERKFVRLKLNFDPNVISSLSERRMFF